MFKIGGVVVVDDKRDGDGRFFYAQAFIDVDSRGMGTGTGTVMPGAGGLTLAPDAANSHGAAVGFYFQCNS